MAPDHHLVKLCFRVQGAQWHLVLRIQVDNLRLIWPGWLRLWWIRLVDHDTSITLWNSQGFAMQLPTPEVGHPLAIYDIVSNQCLQKNARTQIPDSCDGFQYESASLMGPSCWIRQGRTLGVALSQEGPLGWPTESIGCSISKGVLDEEE